MEMHTPWLVGLTPLQQTATASMCYGTEWLRVTEKEMSTSGHPIKRRNLNLHLHCRVRVKVRVIGLE